MTSMMKKLFSVPAALALAGLVACGGGGGGSTPAPTPTASTLAYTDPTSGTYLLKKNTTLSSGSHLVLDLVGPTGTGTGVSAAFSADATRTPWANASASDPVAFVRNGTAFNLGAAPQILFGKVTGNVLQVTAAQKGTGSPVSLAAPLLSVALDLKPNLGLSQGTTLTLSADATKCQVLDGSGAISPITVSVGTLTAQ